MNRPKIELIFKMNAPFGNKVLMHLMPPNQGTYCFQLVRQDVSKCFEPRVLMFRVLILAVLILAEE